METLGAIDFTIIAAYFLLIFGIAWYVTKKEKAGADALSYFLGGRDLGWFAIGASLFASNIGSEHLIGLSGSGARGAFPEAQFEILASLILLLLGWVFVPFYIKSGVFTMPEFLDVATIKEDLPICSLHYFICSYQDIVHHFRRGIGF